MRQIPEGAEIDAIGEKRLVDNAHINNHHRTSLKRARWQIRQSVGPVGGGG